MQEFIDGATAVAGGAGRRLTAAPLGGGPPVAGEDAGGPLAGRGRLADEPRPEARRGDRERGARRRAPRVVRRVLGLSEASTRRRAVGGASAPGPGPRRAGIASGA